MEARTERKAKARMPGELWATSDQWHDDFDGILVTEAGNLNAPVAYIDAAGMIEVCCGADPWEVAEEIAAAFTALDRFRQTMEQADLRHVVDLRNCGGPTQPPMPGFVYGLRCRPRWARKAQVRYPRPFCAHLLNDISAGQLIDFSGDRIEPVDGVVLIDRRPAAMGVPKRKSGASTVTNNPQPASKGIAGRAPTAA